MSSSALKVIWSMPLSSAMPGAFLPVEHAAAALDTGTQRVFVGSSAGILWALTPQGRRLFRYEAGAPIEAAPAVDVGADRVFLATAGGMLDALTALEGKLVWRVKLDGPVRQPPLLARDVVYVATEADSVFALARANGELLWRYHREAPEGFSISGHAGLLLANNKLYTAFSDGAVTALNPGDGTLIWERDTSLDVEDVDNEQTRFIDVDTTPVLLGTSLYAASFSGGLYALSPSSGTVLWRAAEFKGITGMAAEGDALVLSSARAGVICVDMNESRIRWRHAIKRGAPGEPRIADGMVFVGESEGAFLSLSLSSGREIARLETGHGFSSPAGIGGRQGFLVSNGGTLFSFSF